jgi:acyl carrier protein
MSDALKEQVRGLVCEQLGVDPAELSSDSNILEDLGADSLDVVELVMAIEEAFDIEVPDEDAETMRTLGDVERYVSARVAA